MADLPLIIRIKSDKVEAATTAFLARFPKPTKGPDVAITDQKWMEKILTAKMNREIQLGQRELAAAEVKAESGETDYFE